MWGAVVFLALGFGSGEQRTGDVPVGCAETLTDSTAEWTYWMRQVTGFGASRILLTDRISQHAFDRGNLGPCVNFMRDNVVDREMTPADRAAIEEGLRAFEPLLRCKNQPLLYIGRAAHKNPGGKYCNEGSIAGLAPPKEGGRTVVIYDEARGVAYDANVGLDQKGVIAHELMHALTLEFDPRTCTRYGNPLENPFIQEWIAATGWNAAGTHLTGRPKNADFWQTGTPTTYGRTNVYEDIAEAARLYLYFPRHLRYYSPIRYQMIDGLFKSMRWDEYNAMLERNGRQ